MRDCLPKVEKIAGDLSLGEVQTVIQQFASILDTIMSTTDDMSNLVDPARAMLKRATDGIDGMIASINDGFANFVDQGYGAALGGVQSGKELAFAKLDEMIAFAVAFAPGLAADLSAKAAQMAESMYDDIIPSWLPAILDKVAGAVDQAAGRLQSVQELQQVEGGLGNVLGLPGGVSSTCASGAAAFSSGAGTSADPSAPLSEARRRQLQAAHEVKPNATRVRQVKPHAPPTAPASVVCSFFSFVLIAI